MSRRLFVDTGAWKAWLDKKDRFHQVVDQEFERCRRENISLVTTDYIISETLTLLRMRAGLGHALALKFGETIFSSQVIHLEFISTELFHKAWEIFRRYQNKDFSFVDCSSFALMEAQGLKEALSLDQHFTQYGFQRYPVGT